MFKWFKRKNEQSKHAYKVTYCLGATIDPVHHTVKFDINPKWMHEIFVIAETKFEAQVEFAKKIVLWPHVYVHDITQVDVVNTH